VTSEVGELRGHLHVAEIVTGFDGSPPGLTTTKVKA
jgi:hypothetical protein